MCPIKGSAKPSIALKKKYSILNKVTNFQLKGEPSHPDTSLFLKYSLWAIIYIYIFSSLHIFNFLKNVSICDYIRSLLHYFNFVLFIYIILCMLLCIYIYIYFFLYVKIIKYHSNWIVVRSYNVHIIMKRLFLVPCSCRH